MAAFHLPGAQGQPSCRTALSSLQVFWSSLFQLGGAQAWKRQLLCGTLPWGQPLEPVQSQPRPRSHPERPCSLQTSPGSTTAAQAPVSEGVIFPSFFLLCLSPHRFSGGGALCLTEIHLPHCLLCSLGLWRQMKEYPCPPSYYLSPWGHVVWEQQLSYLCPTGKCLTVGRTPFFVCTFAMCVVICDFSKLLVLVHWGATEGTLLATFI